MLDRNNKPDEIWVILKQGGDIYNRYEVSNYGRVWNVKNDFEVSQTLRGEPRYKYVNLRSDCGDVRVGRRVHNIMGWSFLGDPPTPKHTVDHIDRDKLHNHLPNLRWLDRKGQAKNRNCAVLMECGTPIQEYVTELGYDINDEGIGRYILNRTRQGDTLEEALFNWANFLNPYPLKWRKQSFSNSWEYEGIWYPSTEILVSCKGNCSKDTFFSRLKDGMSIEDALCYEYDYSDKHRFEMDGFHMTREEHCERLCISYQRIAAYMNKRGMSFEEAIKVPMQRFIKYSINGEIKRNSDWYKHFGIPSRSANSWLNQSGIKRTFRDVLNKYNIDTSDMDIYPCDGDVIMFNNPI